jgi:hypothetical protein
MPRAFTALSAVLTRPGAALGATALALLLWLAPVPTAQAESGAHRNPPPPPVVDVPPVADRR